MPSSFSIYNSSSSRELELVFMFLSISDFFFELPVISFTHFLQGSLPFCMNLYVSFTRSLLIIYELFVFQVLLSQSITIFLAWLVGFVEVQKLKNLMSNLLSFSFKIYSFCVLRKFFPTHRSYRFFTSI